MHYMILSGCFCQQNNIINSNTGNNNTMVLVILTERLLIDVEMLSPGHSGCGKMSERRQEN